MAEYPTHPVVGVGAVVWRGNDVLLVRRAHPPAQGRWSIPGGKQMLGETVFEAAHREIHEETGVEIDILGVAAVVDLIDHDDHGRIRHHYTVVDVVAEWRHGEAVAGDDAEAVAWVAAEKLPDFDVTPATLDVVARAAALRAGGAKV